MRKICPACGQEWPLDGRRKLPTLPGVYRNRIIELVAGHPGIGMRDLAERVYEIDPNGGPDDAARAVRVTIYHMKKPLAAQGWRLAARRAGYDGYRLSRIN